MTETKKRLLRLFKNCQMNVLLTDIMAELYFRYKVEQGLQDIDKGRIISHEEVRKRMTKWAKSIGH